MEGIDAAAVTAWFERNVPGMQPPLRFDLVSGGKSNLTFGAHDAAGHAYVVRRPPLGHVLATAHDMSREYRIISALWGKGVPVARTYGLCQDASVNGADFYVMDFVDGVVLHDADAARTVADADRQALGEDIIDVLAELHVLDPDAVGLGELGRKEAYLERQLKRWTKQYEDTKTDDIQEMEDCRRLLAEKMPPQIGAGIVHGDYRPGNLIVKGRKVAAVLDWELCTLGDVLADVGYLLNNWTEPGDLNAELLPTGIGGFPTRDELCARYTRRTGRDLSGITYYQAFSHWRLCAIQQGVYKRFLMGAMGDQQIDLDGYQTSLRTRAQRALELLGG